VTGGAGPHRAGAPETLGGVADISRAMRRRTDTTNADRERFELLFDRHRRAVLGYALRRVEQPADAADVLAETFLVAWRRLDDVPAGSAALPWLLAVARRVLANHRRSARRRGGLAERLRGELTAAVPRHGAIPAPDGERGRLAAALARLPEADRELVLLVGWEQLEPAQIAIVLGIPAETVRTRLHRARARLREALAADEADESAAGTPPRSAPASPRAVTAQAAGEGGAGTPPRSAPASPRAVTAQAAGEGGAGTPPRSAPASPPAPSLDAAVRPPLVPAAAPELRAATPVTPVTPATPAAAPELHAATPATPATPGRPHAPARLGAAPPLARPLPHLAKETFR